jgi:hypothetical protein
MKTPHHPAHRLLAWALPVLATTWLLASPARAGTPTDSLPGPLEVSAALAASPAVAAARLGLDAARAGHLQGLADRPGWLATPALARRSGAGSSTTLEAELLIERNLRLPVKRAAAERLGQAREQAALQAWQLAWRQQARSLLERQAAWLRDCQSAAVWAEQQALLSRQSQAVQRRQGLGDAAPVEARQAQAAATQASTQAQLGAARCQAAATMLQAQFPGLPLGDGRAPIELGADSAQASVATWLAASPELSAARREAQALDAQQALDLAELRADPTLGLRVGGSSAGERVLGVQIALSFGGAEQQRATQRANAARRALAEAEVEVLQRRLAAEAGLALQEAVATRAAWQGARLAAVQWAESAAALARGYELGEGSLAELLGARRLAQEQQLAARLAGVEAWQAQQRLALETGVLWAPPAADKAAAELALSAPALSAP